MKTTARASHARLRTVESCDAGERRRDPLSRDSFVATLPARVDTLRCAGRLLKPLASVGAVQEVHCLLHELAGAALAANLDDLAEQVTLALDVPDHVLAEAVRDLVTSLEAAALELEPWSPTVLAVTAGTSLLPTLGRALAATEASGHVVFARAEAEEALAEQPADVVVLDMGPPDADARALLRRIPVGIAWRRLPTIALAPRNNPSLVRECIDAGVEQVLPKPVAPELLAAAINVVLRKRRTIQRDVGRDTLTGLMGRSRFVRELVRGWHRVWRRQAPAACALLDMDGFADFNARQGYRAGSVALGRFAAILQDTLRPTDGIARWSGDSFGVLFTGTDVTGSSLALARVADRLTEAYEGLTFSAGVAPLSHRADVATTIELAQILLLRSKARGGATTSTYDELGELLA